MVRDDGDENLLLSLSAKDDLGGEARAKAAVARQWLLDESLEHTALARRLISDHNDLWQVDKFSDTACE